MFSPLRIFLFSVQNSWFIGFHCRVLFGLINKEWLQEENWRKLNRYKFNEGNKNPPLSAKPRPPGSIRQIYVSQGRGFCTKSHPNLIILGGSLGLHLIEPCSYSVTT